MIEYFPIIFGVLVGIPALMLFGWMLLCALKLIFSVIGGWVGGDFLK